MWSEGKRGALERTTYLRSMSATALWTEEDTRALVGVWGAEDVQNQLDVVARNKAIFEKINCLFPRKPLVPSNMAAVQNED